MLLGVDIGTTHCKAGLFNLDGALVKFASRAMLLRPPLEGYRYYHPQTLFELALSVMGAVCAGVEAQILGIGIASMAETGLLVGLRDGAARTPFIPWFEQMAVRQADRLVERGQGEQGFIRRGIRPSFKCSLAKILWLQEREPRLLEEACWLGAADYLAFRLTGRMGTNRTLAERTAAYRIDTDEWDWALLEDLALPPVLFPDILLPRQAVGEAGSIPGLEKLKGVPVWIAGHDHVVGTFAASRIVSKEEARADWIFDSIGTAESLIGRFPRRPLTGQDAESGFGFGPDLEEPWLCWMGGISASGGSIEWLRAILDQTPLSYDALAGLLAGRMSTRPGKIIYFPHLAGSGSPHSNQKARAGFLGLDANHQRSDLYLAVLEGLAYEAQFIRRRAETLKAVKNVKILAAGGGTRNAAWIQIKADVFGSPVVVLEQAEATLLGAALYAGAGRAEHNLQISIEKGLPGVPTRTYTPDPALAEAYQETYEMEYLAWQRRMYYS